MAIELKTIAINAGRAPGPAVSERTRVGIPAEPRPEVQKPGPAQEAPGKEPAAEEIVADAVDSLNHYMQSLNRELNFSIDEDTGRTVVKIMDRETREVIRQIPPEEALALARRLIESTDEAPPLFQNKA